MIKSTHEIQNWPMNWASIAAVLQHSRFQRWMSTWPRTNAKILTLFLDTHVNVNSDWKSTCLHSSANRQYRPTLCQQYRQLSERAVSGDVSEVKTVKFSIIFIILSNFRMIKVQYNFVMYQHAQRAVISTTSVLDVRRNAVKEINPGRG